MTDRLVRATAIILLVYVGLIGLTGFQMSRMSSGFIPDQDIGYLAIVIQLPPGSSLARTDKVVRDVNDIALKTPASAHLAGGWVRRDDRYNRPQCGDGLSSLPSLYGSPMPGSDAATTSRPCASASPATRTPTSS